MKHRIGVCLALVALVAAMLGPVPTEAGAAPAAPTDETKVPHYFGPYPNYANSPLTLPDATVTISGDGTGATAMATVGANGAITGITITDPGSGYTAAPAVDITGAGTGASATATFTPTGSVTAISVDVAGAGYTQPLVTIAESGGGTGSGATATAFGGVDAVSLDTAGSGYTAPTVDFDLPDDPNGVQARGHVVCVEVDCIPTAPETPVTITGVVVDVPGSGYSSAPGVAILDGTLFDPMNGGAGATATATLMVASVTVDAFGFGYTSAAVDITDGVGLGSGASATATVEIGAISTIAITNPGSGYVTGGGIRKFVDPLPGLCDPAGVAAASCPGSGKYIPLAVPDTSNPYQQPGGPASDTYEIGLVQYLTSFSSDLPMTLVRGYVQIDTGSVSGSQHVQLFNDVPNGLGGYTQVPVTTVLGDPVFAVTPPQYLGPIIGATKDRPVRIVFHHYLPTGSDGNLFLPVDTTIMGSGPGPVMQPDQLDNGTVLDDARNPFCGEVSNAKAGCFTENRATLHLHGGITPWISDGTPHQWITPAGENTPWPEGVSVENVPDMDVCGLADDGCQTFYYTNQQSARLMFYHDHAWGITRLNVYAGEAAGYLITDATEQSLISRQLIPGAADTIPLIIQDKTFVPDTAQLAAQDPTWDTSRWGGYGSLWLPHVYMPAQNPGDPTGMSAFGRWMYGPWFWPPANAVHGPIANPYYDPNCDPNVTEFCEPELIPGTPNITVGMEAFNDTPIVNGTAYPEVTLDPQSYRLRILNAANDRFWNLQWYVADATGTEVALKAAEVAAAQTDPVVFPTPDTTLSPVGPSWIQIGTEGGFLPAPVVVPNQPITWITDPTRFDVGNVDQHSLLLAPAERADVIVDFSRFAGQTLILYNDAPAAFPARVPGYDYYTGGPDLTPAGAPSTLPGYGPNTRTIMRVHIASTTPAPTFNLAALNAAFRHHADGSGVFESGQNPIIVGQAAYNSAYGTAFAASGWCNAPGSTSTRCDGYARIQEQGGDLFGFNTLRSAYAPGVAKMLIPIEPKGMHDEMNAASFDEYGRMEANLGLEAPGATPLLQNIILYPYVNPQTEIIDATSLPTADVEVTPISSAADGTQIWKITHNGVDTHPLHFHLYDVQILNRVTWDNIIIPPDRTELGWKDTIRVSPLEDTIVALRPIIPTVPFELPNSIRTLNPAMPEGSTLGFNNVDANGNPTNPILNTLVNFGWEYVYHCHILSHEEKDMMRPVSVALPPDAPSLAFPTINAQGKKVVTLRWTDNSLTETRFVVQRMEGAGPSWVNLATLSQPLGTANTIGATLTYVDATYKQNTTYRYRIVAENVVGYGGQFMQTTVRSYSNQVGAPSGITTLLSATASATRNGPVGLTWNYVPGGDQTGFTIQRAADSAFTNSVRTFNVGNVSAYSDGTVNRGRTYYYRVAATSFLGVGVWSNALAVTTLP